MKVRCTYCGLSWGISVHKKIPQTGYECPWCAVRKKRKEGRR